MRNCSKMLIKAEDKIRDWKELANADRDTRRQARQNMQTKAEEAMRDQTWIPSDVLREIENRDRNRRPNGSRFDRR